MDGAESRTATPVGPVRVSKNGNARTLTVPAEIVAEAGIELGDQYMVEAIDGDLIYRRVDGDRPRGRIIGEGAQRYLEIPRGGLIPAGPDPVERPPIDWDF